jgi:murein DD-endopeptidase MepM/ murein hydrolase activator NlpD
MPQTPSNFVPDTALTSAPTSGFSANNVDPMRNAAPQQMEQMGDAASKVGDTIDSIASRIQYQLDGAAAKAAETQFLQQSMKIVHGDGTDDNPGYLNTRGVGAVDGYDDAASALAKAKEQIQAGLGNKFQQMLFNNTVTPHLTSVGSAMTDHRFQQGTAYAIQTADDRATMYGLKAAQDHTSWNATDADGNPTGDFQADLQVVDNEILNGQMRKTGSGDASTPVNQSALLQAHSSIVKTSLAQMIVSQDPASSVQGFFDAMKEKGYIDARDEVAMASAVKSYVVPKQRTDAINQDLAAAYRANHPSPAGATAPQGPDAVTNIIKGAGFITAYDKDAGGAYIAIPQNTPVQAPAAGTVSAVGKNDDEVPYVSIQHPDGSTSTITGMNTFNVKAGDKVALGQPLGTSGDSGDQTKASVLWQMADKNGNAIDPTQAGRPAVKLQSITDEKTLQDALASFNQRDLPSDELKQGAAEMEGIVRQNQHMQLAQQEQNMQQAQSQFYANFMHNGRLTTSAIDQPLFHSLLPMQQYQLTEIVTEHNRRALEQARADQNASDAAALASPEHLGAQYYVATHPDMNLNDLTTVAKNLTPQEMIEVAGRITNHESKNVPIDQKMLNESFTQAGLQNLVNMDGQGDSQKTSHQAQFLALHDQLQNNLNAARDAKKAPLNPNEVKAITNDLLVNNAVSLHTPAWYHSNSNYSDDTTANYGSLTPQQMEKAYVNVGNTRVFESSITQEQRDSLSARLLAAGHKATEANIAKAWSAVYGTH